MEGLIKLNFEILRLVAYFGFVIYGFYCILMYNSEMLKKISGWKKTIFALFILLCLIGGALIFFKLDQIINLKSNWLIENPYQEHDFF